MSDDESWRARRTYSTRIRPAIVRTRPAPVSRRPSGGERRGRPGRARQSRVSRRRRQFPGIRRRRFPGTLDRWPRPSKPPTMTATDRRPETQVSAPSHRPWSASSRLLRRSEPGATRSPAADARRTRAGSATLGRPTFPCRTPRPSAATNRPRTCRLGDPLTCSVRNPNRWAVTRPLTDRDRCARLSETCSGPRPGASRRAGPRRRGRRWRRAGCRPGRSGGRTPRGGRRGRGAG
jgi:hypothetical protein